jgi:WD40 repeat protein
MVELWETAGGQKVRTFKGHFGMVRAIAFSPDGTRLATGGLDGTVRLWDVTARGDAVSVPAHALSPWDLTDLSPDGQTLVTGGKKGERKPLQFWDTTTGKPRGGPVELSERMINHTWTDDGKRLYIADLAKTVSVVDVSAGKVVRAFPVDSGPALFATQPDHCIALSPDERWFAQGAPDGTIRLRDARTGVEARTIGKLDDELMALAFSPDGSRLVGADRATLKIWDFPTGRELAATSLSGIWIRVARFSADGKRLAIAGILPQFRTRDVRILDAENLREVWSLNGHTFTVLDAVFSPDRRRLATASLDGTVRIWDLGTGQEVLKVNHGGFLRSVRFVSDGRRLISSSTDRQIAVWDATPIPD